VSAATDNLSGPHKRLAEVFTRVYALEAEIQRLREENDWYDDQLRGLLGDFQWLLEQHPEHRGARSDDRIRVISAALDGTP
jgi:hypothetical protein